MVAQSRPPLPARDDRAPSKTGIFKSGLLNRRLTARRAAYRARAVSKAIHTIVSFEDREHLACVIMDPSRVPDGTRVVFAVQKHTSAQRIRFHAMINELAKQAVHNGRKYNAVQWKAILLQALGQEIEFLPTLDGKSFFPTGFHTSDFSKEQMSDAIEMVFSWGAEHGVKFKEPSAPPNLAPPIGQIEAPQRYLRADRLLDERFGNAHTIDHDKSERPPF